MLSKVREQVVSAVLSAVILAILAAIWQAATAGGLITLLGGLSPSEIDTRIRGGIDTRIDSMQADFGRAEDRIDARIDGMQADFGPAEEKNVNEVYQAAAAGIVSATLDTTSARQGAICGFTAASRESLNLANRARSATMRAAASIEYRNGVYVPLAAISMPVGTGQYWVVAGCSGNAGTEEAVTIYFYSLQLRE